MGNDTVEYDSVDYMRLIQTIMCHKETESNDMILNAIILSMIQYNIILFDTMYR